MREFDHNRWQHLDFPSQGVQLASPAFWSCAISTISGRDWLSVSPSIHFFVHGQMLFLEIGKRREREREKGKEDG